MRKKVTLMLLVLIIIVFIGCNKENFYMQHIYIVNHSSHSIDMFYYLNGTVVDSFTTRLKTGDSVLSSVSSSRFPGYLQSERYGDSIIVVFDNLFRISHYKILPLLKASKYYDIKSLRNLMNINSFEYTYERLTKYKYGEYYKYIFTEQDYLDAK